MKSNSINRLIALSLVTTSVAMGSNLQAIKANAATTDTNKSFTVEAQGETINVNINKVDENNVKVSTTTSTGETHELTYNKNDDYMIMDGRKVSVELTTEIDKSKMTSSKINVASAYTPVYECTNKLTYSDMVSTVGAIVTLAAAVITFGIASFGTVAVKAAVEKSLAAIGVGTVFGSAFLRGYVKYDQYRTSEMIPTGNGSSYYMHRTQNYKFGGQLGDETLATTGIGSGVGDWYYSSKPY